MIKDGSVKSHEKRGLGLESEPEPDKQAPLGSQAGNGWEPAM